MVENAIRTKAIIAAALRSYEARYKFWIVTVKDSTLRSDTAPKSLKL